MGDLVGTASFPTWGAFRTPIGVKNENINGGVITFSTRTVGSYSMSYDFGFKLFDDGLITTIPIYTPQDSYPILYYADYGIDGDPPPPSRLALTSTYGPFGGSYPQPPLNEIELEAMVSRLVTLNGGGVSLNSDAWTMASPVVFNGQPVPPLLGNISGLAGFSPFGMFP